MRSNAKSITTSPEIVKHIDGLTEANFKLLTMLVPWLATQEKQQRKFRNAVLIRLARIETMASMILVGQMAEQQLKKQPFYYQDKLKKDSKAAEEFISKNCDDISIAAIKYIYGKDPIPEVRRDRRKKWHEWEI